MAKVQKNSPKVLGLDVSTKTIGVALFDISSQQLLELTHISPLPKPKTDNKIAELINKSGIVRQKLMEYQDLGITKVIIEEPLLNSNNIYTVSTLMRYNTLICKEVFDVLGLVPEFITTYNAIKAAFPEIVQKNDKGKFVLFGGYPKTVDKKEIIWEQVAKREPQITWLYTRNNTLKKECFDMSDSYTCVLGYMRTNKIW